MTRQALVLEDSAVTRKIIADMLRGLAFQVTEAPHGKAGIERLRELSGPVLALIDWNMPELDGLEFVRRVRADRAYDQVTLIMVTKEIEMHKVREALSTGADEYLMKPFTRGMLIEKLALVGIRDLV